MYKKKKKLRLSLCESSYHWIDHRCSYRGGTGGRFVINRYIDSLIEFYMSTIKKGIFLGKSIYEDKNDVLKISLYVYRLYENVILPYKLRYNKRNLTRKLSSEMKECNKVFLEVNLNNLCEILKYIFNKDVILDIKDLSYPYLDEEILGKYLGNKLYLNRRLYRRMVNEMFIKSNIKMIEAKKKIEFISRIGDMGYLYKYKNKNRFKFYNE